LSRISITTLRKMKQAGEKIACLTAYDASFSKILEAAGVEILLVGDSLGMVVQGRDSTLPVTLEEMIYHTSMVSRASERALIITDMPFMTYNDMAQALHSAGRLMKEGGAHMVKLEGGAPVLDMVQAMADFGIPVCAHLGLQPQSVHKLGGYRQQGKDALAAKDILHDALALEASGADVMLLESVPAALGKEITEALKIPVIGIGAGPDVDGQILVTHDMLGLYTRFHPRFVRRYAELAKDMRAAFEHYARDVRSGEFPSSDESY